MNHLLNPVFGGGVAPFYPVSIPYSCRFDSARSTKFTRTPAVADSTRNIWSLAADLKICKFSGYQALLIVYVDANNYEFIQYNGSDGYQFYYGAKVGGVNKGQVSFDPVQRDPSQWGSFLFTKNGATVKGYMNGVEMAQTVSTTPDAGALFLGGTYQHEIGTYNKPDWYCANHRFLVGTAYSPSDFWQASQINPTVWIPKTPSGLAYGTTGWHLDFADASALGNDVSGNNNDFASSGFTTADQFTDTPTNNCPTWNSTQPTTGTNVYSEGALRLSKTDTGGVMNASVVPFRIPSTGKWQVGIKHISNSVAVSLVGLGQFTSDLGTNGYVTRAAVGTNGNVYTPDYAPNNLNIGALSANDTLSFLVDADDGSVKLKKNGTLVNSGNAIITGLTFSGSSGWYLYMQSAGAGAVATFEIIPPATDGDYKALCTSNLTLPATEIMQSHKGMNAKLYTGTGATQNITSFDFQPDLVWLKDRGGYAHVLIDSVRGADKAIYPNQTSSESTLPTDYVDFDGFLTNGFTVGVPAGTNIINGSGRNLVAWGWKKSATYGMDIVSYTGTGAVRTVAHGLGAVPEMIIVKNLDDATSGWEWPVYHHKVSATPQNSGLILQTTAALSNTATLWNNTAPTSSVFTVANNYAVNMDTKRHVAYLFRSVPGFSKFGSYTGNGNADGPFVDCGFRPRWLLVKNASDGIRDWCLWDAARNTYNVVNWLQNPNADGADIATNDLDFTSNGFKIKVTNQRINGSGNTMIYAAFAESPFPWNNAR